MISAFYGIMALVCLIGFIVTMMVESSYHNNFFDWLDSVVEDVKKNISKIIFSVSTLVFYILFLVSL